MIFEIDEIERKIGYTFKDKLLLRQCFTHSSYAYENGEKDNELLEFFGDSIMEFIVTEYLYKHNLGDEGKLTFIRAEIVSKTPLLESVRNLGLTEHVLLGNGAKKHISPDDKLFSSIYEALVAGMYFDGGLTQVRKFVKKTIINDYLKKAKQREKANKNIDAKSLLQEYVQKTKIGSIRYTLLWKKGPDHNPEFKVAVLLNNGKIAEGKGPSKKLAEMKAASVALKKIKGGNKQ